MKFSYSATKTTEGKFSGGVYAQKDDGTWAQIALFEDIKNPKNVKALVKAEANRYKELQKDPDSHYESHSINGSLEV